MAQAKWGRCCCAYIIAACLERVDGGESRARRACQLRVKSLHLFLKRSHAHDRLCAVSDGVYAIALTLLVLDLKVPDVPGIPNSELTTDLVRQIPNFVVYIVGFILIARFWINHHRIFQSVAFCDEWTLSLNLVHLFFISLTPYAASLIGHYEAIALPRSSFHRILAWPRCR